MLSRRVYAFTSAACIALAVGIAPIASSAQRRAPEQRERNGTGPEDVLPFVLGGLGVFGGTQLIDSLTGKDWASPRELDRDGPVFPKRQAIGRYQVQGYALPGWPVVVDVETSPGTETWLAVNYRGKKKEALRVRIPGEGRRVHVVQLPSTNSPELTTARYSLHSFTTERRKQIYRPHNVYAVGAGPRAVGSTTLQIASLGPSVARRPADVRYSLVAKRLFDRSSIEVLRLPSGKKGAMKMIKEERRFPLQAGTHAGNWGAMKVDPRPTAGTYHFQARAWLVGGRNDARDWTGAIAPNFVRVP